MPTQFKPHRRGRRAGFTIAEVALSLVVFTLMTVMFAATFPMAVCGAQYGGNYAQGTMLAQHKMEQLRTTGYTRLFDSGQLLSLNVIDAVNPDGSYDFTSSDNLTTTGTTHGYFPPGSTGTITVTPYVAGGAPAGTLAYVTVKIAWTGGGVSGGSTSVSAIVSKDAQP